MDRDHFYVTLFSNASQDIYPDNKIAAFTTQLAQPIRLDPSDIWEVGLCELSYSVTSWQPKVLDMRYFMNALMYCSHSVPAHRHHKGEISEIVQNRANRL